MPEIITNTDIVTIGVPNGKLETALKELIPWRKGPFNIFGTYIDSEWKSYLKWNRFCNHLPKNSNKVLDIGCNNGYYLFRLSNVVNQVIGIDPTLHYFKQFSIIQKYANVSNIKFLPLRLESFDETDFDLILYLGVIYHSRNPLMQLNLIYQKLIKGGMLILETLGINETEDSILIPKERYLGMRNVWFVPSLNAIINMLERSKFKDIEVISSNYLGVLEQRSTTWTGSRSLSDFLDSSNQKTIEGYDLPTRFILKAFK